MHKVKRFISITMVVAFLLLLVDSSLASSLPVKFIPRGQFAFQDQPDSSVGKGIPSIEIGPDHQLWMFQPPLSRKGKNTRMGASGKIQTLNAGNGVLLDKDTQLSEQFGTAENGAVFTKDGQLLSFRTGLATATLRDSVDGQWFNGDDKVSTMRWPFGVLLTVGPSEPSPAAFGPQGTLYITAPRENKILLFTAQDATDLGNAAHTFQVAELAQNRFGRRPMGIAFDQQGNMFLSTRDLLMGKNDEGDDILHDVLIGIDPVDGIFFNKNDVMKVYDLNVILAPTDEPLANVLITDIAFDHQGHLILFDAKTETLHRLRPVLGFFDQFGDGLPSRISFPSKNLPEGNSEVH